MNENTAILLVEDEDTLAIGLEFNLSAEGYRVTRAADGLAAVEQIQSSLFDLVILDIMLPFLDGFAVAEKIRAKDPQTPILILTARTELKDRIRGLEIGADDYLTKPFHLDELLLRVKGMLKRKKWYKQATEIMPVYRFGDNEINFDNFTCRAGDKTVHLTAHEAMLLKYLIDHENKVVSRKELLAEVWNLNSDIETRTVDNFIARLRKYFESNPENPVYIKSIRGVGYIFRSEPSQNS
ncbi:MAG TPA: response regulator transcription factor [Bacteroidetes bacterium]|nr:response regulator transcription factor [Bacteroidota bacterium]